MTFELGKELEVMGKKVEFIGIIDINLVFEPNLETINLEDNEDGGYINLIFFMELVSNRDFL